MKRFSTADEAAQPLPPAGATKRPRVNQPGRPTASELDRRKARVMEVATELFVKQGFAATSLVDIARCAGVATRTLYQHFGDKEAIFRDVIMSRDTGTPPPPPAVQPGDTLFDCLRRAGQYCYAVTYQPHPVGIMRLMIAEGTRFPEFIKGVATSISGRYRRNFEKIFVSLEAAGLIPPGDHGRSGELFSDLLLGSHPMMVYTNWSATLPSAENVDERITLFILGRFGAEIAKISRTHAAQLPLANRPEAKSA